MAKHLHAAAFDTKFDTWYAGSATKSLAKTLRAAGYELVSKPKHFMVSGMQGPLVDNALEQAKLWANQIKHNISS